MAEPLVPRVQEDEDERIRALIAQQLMRKQESDPATAETLMGRGFDAAPLSMLDAPPAPPSNLDPGAVNSALARRLGAADRERNSALAQPSPDHGTPATVRTQDPGGDGPPAQGFTPYHTPESGAKVELEHRLDTVLRNAPPREAQTLINVLKMAQSDEEIDKILTDFERGTMTR